MFHVKPSPQAGLEGVEQGSEGGLDAGKAESEPRDKGSQAAQTHHPDAPASGLTLILHWRPGPA